MAICICFTSNTNLLILYLIIVEIYLIHQISVSHCLEPQQKDKQTQAAVFHTTNNKCNEKCGGLMLPFPFYLSYSCGGSVFSDVFRLSCVMQQQTSEQLLYLNLGSQNYRILQFFTDGVLVDYLPNTNNFSSSSSSSSSCSPYADLALFSSFEGNDYFGISPDNVVGLYNCHDTSFCKPMPMPDSASCEEETCWYPLSDELGLGSVYRKGFSVFSHFGCKGFSCWVVLPYSSSGNNTNTTSTVSNTLKQGLKLEWAIPRNSSKAICSANAYTVNATSITSGVRCQCPIGFFGDAFAHGIGCFKSCLKDGTATGAYHKDCIAKKHLPRERAKVLIGIVASALTLASLTGIYCASLKRTNNKLIPDKAGTKQIRLFSYDELEQATNGFEDSQKLGEGTNGALYAGIFGDGSYVAVQKFEQKYFNDDKGRAVFLQSLEVLSTVAHRNMARVVGCCLDTSMTPLVVYEYPNYGTLEQHLRLHSPFCGNNNNINVTSSAIAGLEWRKRLKVASETADLLAFLSNEIYPPIIHQHDLHPAFIFLDYQSCVKVAGFLPAASAANIVISSNTNNTTNEDYSIREGGGTTTDHDVYNIGLLLVDLIAGVGETRFPSTIALGKITSGKVEEIADPLIQYDENKGEIDIVGDLATRCLLFGNKLGMINVARELMHLLQLKNQNTNTSNSNSFVGCSGSSSSRRGPPPPPTSLDETFSNSSLLQMISMSPDSIYAPHFSV